jgi:DNA helicase IV
MAQETLDLLHGSRSTDLDDDEDGEELTASDVLDAEALADRQQEVDLRSAAERASVDRTWTFGHVVVDEAQELSPMAWRLVLRKVPTRSMTVVGDVAQTGSTAGADSWDDVLSPHLGAGGWRTVELSVNYRTPVEVMSVAADVLAAAGSAAVAPESVRSTGEQPWVEQVDESALPDRAAALAAELVGEEGTLAVVVPAARLAEVATAVTARVPDAQWGPTADPTQGPLVATPTEVKGLEFDSVLLIDPQGVLDGAARGVSDLYVALTRPTQRLGVLTPGPLPPGMERLSAR